MRQWSRRSVLQVVFGVAAILGAAPSHVAQAESGPALGTVTGSVTLDGKALALRHAVAVLRPDVFDETKDAFTLAFTARPLAADPLPKATAGERLAGAVKAGIVLHVGQNHYCKIVIRDPGLGGSELQNMGGGVCEADSIKVFGPDRVEGTIVSFPQGKEEDIAGHKVGYTLHFNAPVVKRSR